MYERAAAGGPRARGAAETMAAHGDRGAFELFSIEIPKEEWHSIFPLHAELLVEIAVINFALPTDAQGSLAHQAGDRGGVERFDQQLHVGV